MWGDAGRCGRCGEIWGDVVVVQLDGLPVVVEGLGLGIGLGLGLANPNPSLRVVVEVAHAREVAHLLPRLLAVALPRGDTREMYDPHRCSPAQA